MVKELDYAFAVARIRANERYMLSASDVEALIMAENVEKAVSFLYTKSCPFCGQPQSIGKPAKTLSDVEKGSYIFRKQIRRRTWVR